MTTGGHNGGRVLAKLTQELRAQIACGEIAVGGFVPSVRQISQTFGVSSKSAHSALKSLAGEGLLAAEPYRGYRVVAGREVAKRPVTLAYILGTHTRPRSWDDLHRVLMASLQDAAHARGWPLLSLSLQERTPHQEILATLRASHAAGVALDLADPAMVSAIRAAGMSAVLVDSDMDNPGVDVVVQDGQMGGMQAVKHLLACGCRRIAWVGNTCATAHSRDRLSGAMIGLHCAGLGGFAPGMMVDLDPLNPDDRALPASTKGRVRKLLTGKNRPDGILALWAPYAHLVCQVAREMGVVLGRDFHLVGWSVAEMYESFYKPGFARGAIPPAITWQARTMADTAVARLSARREDPSLPPLRIKIPTGLVQEGARHV